MPMPSLVSVRRRRIAAALALAVCWGSGASRADTGQIWTAMKERLEASGVTVTVDRETVDRQADEINLEGVTLVAPSPDTKAKMTIRVARWVQARSVMDGTELRSLGRLRLDDVSVSSDDGSVSASLDFAEIADLAVPAGLRTFTFDETRPVAALASFLRVLEGQSVGRVALGAARVTGVSKDSVTGGDVTTNVSLDGFEVSGGKGLSLETVHVGPIDIQGTEKGEPFTARFGGLDITGVDLGALQRLIDPTTYAGGVGDGTWRTLIRSYDIHGLSVTADKVQAAVGHIGYADFDIRQPARALTDLLDREARGEETLSQSDKAKAGLELISAFRLGSYRLGGIKIVEADKVSMTLDEFGFDQLSLAGLGGLHLTGLDVAADGNLVSLKEFSLGALDLPPLSILLDVVSSDPTSEAWDKLALYTRLAGMSLKGLVVRPSSAGTVSLDAVEITAEQDLGKTPTAMGMTVEHLRLPADLGDPQWREMMAGLGYKVIDVSGELSLRHDPQAGELSIAPFKLTLVDGGTIDLRGVMNGVTTEMLMHLDNLEPYLAQIGFVSGELTITDHSLLDRTLRYMAKQQKKSVDDMRASVITAVGRLSSQVPVSQQRDSYLKAVTAFVRQPGALTVTATPDTPVPLIGILATIYTNPFKLSPLIKLDLKSSR